LNYLETVREKLHKSMELNQKDTVLKLSQELDKIILDYLKEGLMKKSHSKH
jgi:hypothetical protein